ncbi:G-protein coupled receptor 22-like [Gigantopelta aegis]|uniref:G-protein coupled receptor 22-like n=1 Tax=Gigantopelta aegis TaxID=1735272 RepID=UPI001B889FB5|nr:G-protein coupled receptor 22-like [Gigantopelta aegis]
MTSLEYDLAFIAVAAAILILQFVLGLFFNLVVLVASQRVLLTNQDHGQGNHFIQNLNIVDLILCVTAIPVTLVALFKSYFPHTLFCYFLEAIVAFVSVASLMTLLMVTLDRYFAIVTPTRERIITTKLNYFLILIWSLAVLSFCTPFFALNKDSLSDVGVYYFSCNYVINHNSPYYFYELCYVLIFVITTVGMILFYVAICRSASKHSNIITAVMTVSGSLSEGTMTGYLQRKRDTKRLRVSKGIVITFALLWGPHVVITVIQMVVSDSIEISMAKIVCLLLAYTTTIVHPLMYAVIRRKIRDEIIKAWRRKVAPMPQMEVGI